MTSRRSERSALQYRELGSAAVHWQSAASSLPALERAVELAHRLSLALELVAVVPRPLWQAWAERKTQTELARVLRDSTLDRLREAVAGVAGAAGVVTPCALTGRTATELVRRVVAQGHDLLIKGAAGRGDPDEVTTELRLLRTSPCPILLADPTRPEPLDNILVAIDVATADATEDAQNERLVDLAAILAEAYRAHLTVVHVFTSYADLLPRFLRDDLTFRAWRADQPPGGRTGRDLAERQMERLRLRPSGARISDTVVTTGHPANVLIQMAQVRADLIVLGTVSQRLPDGIVLGRTAFRVARALPCSVLAVPPLDPPKPVATRERNPSPDPWEALQAEAAA